MKKIIIAVSLLFFASLSNAQCISGNCYNGYGTYQYGQNEKYIGYFERGERHGDGIYYFSSGDKHIGHWKNHKRFGWGKEYDISKDLVTLSFWKPFGKNSTHIFSPATYYYYGGKLSHMSVEGKVYHKDELEIGLEHQKSIKESIEAIELAHQNFIKKQKIEFKNQLTEIGDKVGREVMNSYSQLQWHTSGFNVMRKPYTISGDVITLPLKVTWSAAYIDRKKTYMVVFDLVLDSETNSYHITNIVENRNAQYAKALVNNIDEIIAIVKPMIDSAMESFKESVRNADYSAFNNNYNKTCYEIIKEDKKWTGSITYKVECKNGDIKTFFYNADYNRYDNGRLPNTFDIKIKNEAAKSACYCN